MKTENCFFSRDTLLSFRPTIQKVPLDKRGGHVFIRELSVSEVMDYSKKQTEDPKAAVYWLIQIATTDEGGTAIFQEGDAIAKLPYEVSNFIVDAILEFSNLKGDVKKKPKPTPADDSK